MVVDFAWRARAEVWLLYETSPTPPPPSLFGRNLCMGRIGWSSSSVHCVGADSVKVDNEDNTLGMKKQTYILIFFAAGHNKIRGVSFWSLSYPGTIVFATPLDISAVCIS